MSKSFSSSRNSAFHPPHWPSDVRYISEQLYHTSVPSEIRSIIIRPQNGHGGDAASQPIGLTAIRQISDPTHPAHGQFGLFAAKKISPRTRIVDYIGEVHCDDRPESDYDLSLHRTQDGLSVGIDASRAGNEARFINDYRGVKPKPNAAFEERRAASGELRMSVWSGSEVIRKGDEILVSYGKAWWRARSGDQS